jgi:hypothetical protein
MKHYKLTAKRGKARAGKTHLVPIIVKKHPLSTAVGLVTTLGVASGIIWVYLKNHH